MENQSTASYHEKRVEEVLAVYLEAARRGQAPDRSELLTRHPDLAADLEDFFSDHDLVRDMAEPLRTVVVAEQAPSPRATDTATLPSDELPDRFGDYELLAEIARGGMGIVYRARQVRLQREVALKMLFPGGRALAEVEHFLHTEAAAVASLDHPNIVPIYEAGTHAGRPFFSMKLIDGADLKRWVPDARASSSRAAWERDIAQLLAAVARAVHHAHQRGILHRDLKPSNVLIDRDGRPHVTDFGLAKRVEGDSALSQEGGITGTPAYMSPEQASGEKRLTTAVDVYGLGAILYELLTGRPPFRAPTPLDTIFQVRTEEPPRPRATDARIDRDLETICLKCLEKGPSDRYASAAAVAEDLERWLRGEPIVARPASAWERIAKWAQRRPALAALGCTAAALLLAMLGVLAWGWQQAEDRVGAEAVARTAAEEKATMERQRAEEAGRRERAVEAHLALERGLNRIDRGEIGHGLLWLARGLEVAPDDEAGLQGSLRLTLGSWKSWAPRPGPALEHGDHVFAAAFTHDGKVLATGDASNKLRAWEVATGTLLGKPVDAEGNILRIALSRDGTVLMATAAKPGEASVVRVWKVNTGERLARIELKEPRYTTAISPDGKRIFIAGEKGAGELWDGRTGKLLGTLADTTCGQTQDAVFLPDGKALLTATEKKGVQRWDVVTGRPTGPPLLPDFCYRIFVPADGRTFLAVRRGSSPTEAVAQRYETETGRPVGRPLQAVPWVSDVAISNLLPFAKLPPLSALQVEPWVSDVAMSPDGALVLIASSGAAQLWDATWGSPIGPSWPMLGKAIAVAIPPGGPMVLTAGENCHLWRIPPPPRPRQLGEGRMEDVTFSPDGKLLAAVSPARVQLWDVEKGRPLLAPIEHGPFGVRCATFSPDGKLLATAGNSGGKDLDEGGVDSVRFWDVRSGKPQGEPLMQPSFLRVLRFSADGKELLTIGHLKGKDSVFHRWDVATGKALSRHELPNRYWRTSAITPRGTYLVMMSDRYTYPGKVEIFDVATRGPVAELVREPEQMRGLAFSPDETTFLTMTDADGFNLRRAMIGARLWDTRTCKPRSEPRSFGFGFGHGDDMQSAFAPDGSTFLTLQHDSLVFWDRRTFRPLGTPIATRDFIFAEAWCPRGRTVATATQDHGVRLWEAPERIAGDPERLRLWAEVITGLELDAGQGAVELDEKTWRERYRRLQELGGPP
jgi:WD40 repeat protein/tRNA A-37 threonylcarbamoyl transferase component Bud32